jgi:hypothetical protein
LLVAQSDLTGSSGLLLFLLGGGLIGALISAYRFVVNLRTTERTLSRQRIQQANRDQRAALHEAGMWQGRCADLEYLLRSNGIAVPPLSKELRDLVSSTSDPEQAVDWNIAPDGGKLK